MLVYNVTGSSDGNLLHPRRPFETLRSKQMLGHKLDEGGACCTVLPSMC